MSSEAPNDGRPCATDLFIDAALTIENHYDLRWVLERWNEGDWNRALSYFSEEQRTRLKAGQNAS